jgi:spermidine/putrescine transport system substrate-binding protein
MSASHDADERTTIAVGRPPGDAARLTRRSFIGRSAGVALSIGGTSALLAACGGSSGSGGSVNVLGWEAYIDPTVKKLWAKSYPNIALHGIPASADAEMLNKLRAGGASAYDVVFADFGYCPIYYKQGLIEALDLGKMSAGRQLYPQFRQDVAAFPYLLAPDRAIGFPCEWAPGALTFNTTVGLDATAPYSWTLLWDPSIPEGKVGFPQAPDDIIATAALAKGFPTDHVYSLTQSELESVVSYLREIKPFRLYNADPVMRTALRTEEVWAESVPTPGFASKINQEAGRTVAQSVVPQEGSVGFVDGPMLVKDAKNRENGLTFINWFASDPALRDYIFEAYRAAPCNQVEVERLLAKGGETARLVTELKGPEPEIATKVAQVRPPSDPKAYAAAWDAVLA